MPTYEYRCAACGHAFELFQSITEGTKRKCPECKKPKLERLIGAGAGIIFRGAGFYQTDYRSDAYKEAAKAESASGKPPEAKAEAKPESGKSDSKPAPSKEKGKRKGKSE